MHLISATLQAEVGEGQRPDSDQTLSLWGAPKVSQEAACPLRLSVGYTWVHVHLRLERVWTCAAPQRDYSGPSFV